MRTDEVRLTTWLHRYDALLLRKTVVQVDWCDLATNKVGRPAHRDHECGIHVRAYTGNPADEEATTSSGEDDDQAVDRAAVALATCWLGQHCRSDEVDFHRRELRKTTNERLPGT
jgi:hypothetical protein